MFRHKHIAQGALLIQTLNLTHIFLTFETVSVKCVKFKLKNPHLQTARLKNKEFLPNL